MYKLFVLLKNQKLKKVDEEELKTLLYEKYDKISLILFPVIDYNVNGWIPVKPNQYMRDFSYGTVTYRIEARYMDFNSNFMKMEKIKKVTKEVSSIVELYNIFHSLDNMDYLNSVISDIVEGSSDTYGIDISEFRIELFDKKSSMIYRKNTSMKQNKTNVYIWNINFIYKEIADIYNPLLPDGYMSGDEKYVIDIDKMRWDDLTEEMLNLIISEPVSYNILIFYSASIGLFLMLTEEQYSLVKSIQLPELHMVIDAPIIPMAIHGLDFLNNLTLINMIEYISLSIYMLLSTELLDNFLGVNNQRLRYFGIFYANYADMEGNEMPITISYGLDNIPTLEHILRHIRVGKKVVDGTPKKLLQNDDE